MTSSIKKIGPGWTLTMLVLGVGAALFALAMRDTLARSGRRVAVADFGRYGPLTLRLTSEPNPLSASEMANLSFAPLDARKRPMALDRLAYAYARQCGDPPAQSGDAEPMANSSGMWMGMAMFDEPGAWCLIVTARRDAEEAVLRYTFTVE
jgi:hypothetical protein